MLQIFHRVHFACCICQMFSAYLVKVGKLDLPSPVSSEILMSCYMSCHFFLPEAIVFSITVFSYSFFYRSNLFLLLSKMASVFLHASTRFSTV